MSHIKDEHILFQIIDLRRELECRNLSSKGLKSQLIARLTKASKAEEEQEKSHVGDEVWRLFCSIQ